MIMITLTGKLEEDIKYVDAVMDDEDDLREKDALGLWGRNDDSGPQFARPRVPKGFEDRVDNQVLEDVTLVCVFLFVYMFVCLCVCLFVQAWSG